MHVILFGYRGSGKTSIGRKLAGALWKDFVDTDAEVRQRFGGRSIAEVWDDEGEAAFREAEVDVTCELMKREDELVIALGGGTVMQGTARAAVEAADAKRIYLKCKPEELARRIAADLDSIASRPSLTAGGSSLDEIAAVLAQREPVYEAVSDIVFEVTHCTVEQAVTQLTRHYL